MRPIHLQILVTMSVQGIGDPANIDQREPEQAKAPLCCICLKAAVGQGPFSRQPMCEEHTQCDLASAWKLKDSVAEELCSFFESGPNPGHPGSQALVKELQTAGGLKSIENRCLSMRTELDGFYHRVQKQIDEYLTAVRKCQASLDDTDDYRREMATAEAANDIDEVVRLSMSMQLSLPDLESEFDVAQRLRLENDRGELRLRRLLQLERLVGSTAADAGDDVSDAAVTAEPDVRDAELMAQPSAVSIGVTASPAMRDAELTVQPELCDASATASDSMLDPILFSHQIVLDSRVDWLAVCTETGGFLADRSGRVVTAAAAGDSGGDPLPQPCIFARVCGCKYLQVLSVDGTTKLRCEGNFDFKQSIHGLLCHCQKLFVAQSDAVTVTDLSGQILYRIPPPTDDFCEIRGIGSNSEFLFVTSGNRIAAMSLTTLQLGRIIVLHQVVNADLRNLTVHNECILVVDAEHKQVHRVRIDTQQLVASHPTERCGLDHFAWPVGVASDRRGRLFVSEMDNHLVRAADAVEGSLVWSYFELPGQMGGNESRLNRPWGLAVVFDGPRELLIVADYLSMRLLVFDCV